MHEEDLIKLAIAALLGTILGLERELKRKPLGLKTCIIICLTSCLITIVSVDSAVIFDAGSQKFTADPTRITAQIVSGIGFLGAGVILRKSHEIISGLTTAAMVWAASGLGITVGSGFYFEAICGILFMIVGVEILPWAMRKWGPRVMRERELDVLLCVSEDQPLSEIVKQLCVIEARVEQVKNGPIQENTREIRLLCVVPHDCNILSLYNEFSQISGVENISLERL